MFPFGWVVRIEVFEQTLLNVHQSGDRFIPELGASSPTDGLVLL